jgi:integrase
MKINLAPGVTVRIGKPHLNGSFYWIKRRVPKELVQAFGGREYLQRSLQTKDPDEAFLRYVVASREIDQIFKDAKNAQKRGLPIPLTISFLEERFGKRDEYLETYGNDELIHGSELLIDELVEKAQKAASKILAGEALGSDGRRLTPDQAYESISPLSVATPSELAYLRTIQSSNGAVALADFNQFTINDARNLYLSLHPKGKRRSVLLQTNYAINSYIDFCAADIPLTELTRVQIRSWIQHQIKSGLAPGTVLRRLNQFKAVIRCVASEFGRQELLVMLTKLSLPIPVKAVKTKYVPSVEVYKTLLLTFADDPLTTFVILFGGRVGEVAGLKVSDFKLDVATPYLEVRYNEYRDLKTEVSERDFPLVGLALSTAKRLVEISAENSSVPDRPLLLRYARDRGNDALSALLNKRLKVSGLPLTTHCFRHGLKDLLRRVNVAEHLMDSIQGHGRDTVSRSYGHGHAIEQKAAAMAAAYKLIGAL